MKCSRYPRQILSASSGPARALGIEISAENFVVSPISSGPARALGIEILMDDHLRLNLPSGPARALGIEISSSVFSAVSAPGRGLRGPWGLKYWLLSIIWPCYWSGPARALGIEISQFDEAAALLRVGACEGPGD